MITREEAKKDLSQKLQLGILKIGDYVDKLFDDFKSQLSSNPLQLTCEQCKYLKPETCDDYEQCKFDDVCIRWEANLKTDHFQLKDTK